MAALKFLRSSRIGLFYIFGVLLTLILILIYDYLPQRQYRLLPAYDAWAFSTDDRERGGSSVAQWIGDDNSLWRCELRHSDDPGCAIGVALSRDTSDWTAGIDFSTYEAVVIDIDYSGPAKLIRMHFRNFDEQISTPEDYNSPKFNKINLRVNDLKEPIRIDFSEFQLADWWINQYDIPRKWSQTTFDRVTSFGMDFAAPAPLGTHEIKINRIEFVGNYVSSDTWYLGILGIWMGIILSTSLYRLHDLRKRSLRDKLRLQEMADYAREMREQAKDFQQQSRIDALTGTYNRFGLQHIIDTAFEWRRKGDRLSLLLMDLDYFKAVNDTYGHTAGDQVLKAAANLLLSNTRSFDSVARWGGEEFIILCPQTEPENAMKLAEKIRLKLKQLEFPEHPKLQLSATFGVCEVKEGESFALAFARADTALYDGKRQGRDRCVLATD